MHPSVFWSVLDSCAHHPCSTSFCFNLNVTEPASPLRSYADGSQRALHRKPRRMVVVRFESDRRRPAPPFTIQDVTLRTGLVDYYQMLDVRSSAPVVPPVHVLSRRDLVPKSARCWHLNGCLGVYQTGKCFSNHPIPTGNESRKLSNLSVIPVGFSRGICWEC